MDTRSVIEHHLGAFSEGDVEGMLEDYTDDSVMLTPDAEIRGRDALRAAFEGLLSGLFKPGTYDFTMDAMKIEGEVGYIAWHASCASAEVPLGTDTFLVRDGRIALQTFAARIEPR